MISDPAWFYFFQLQKTNIISVSLAQPSLPSKTHQISAEAKASLAFIRSLCLSVCVCDQDKSTNFKADFLSNHWSQQPLVDLKIWNIQYIKQAMVGSYSKFKLNLRGPNQSVKSFQIKTTSKYEVLNISATTALVVSFSNFKLKIMGPNQGVQSFLRRG